MKILSDDSQLFTSQLVENDISLSVPVSVVLTQRRVFTLVPQEGVISGV